jgi:hypothetical protein
MKEQINKEITIEETNEGKNKQRNNDRRKI